MNYGSVLNSGQTYQFIVSPAISSLSNHASGSKGIDITITGTGFSLDPTEISVTAAGLPCSVTSSSTTQIVCTVGSDISGNTYGLLATNTTHTQTNGYISGTGFNYARYETTSLNSKTISSLRSLIGTANEQISQIPYDD